MRPNFTPLAFASARPHAFDDAAAFQLRGNTQHGQHQLSKFAGRIQKRTGVQPPARATPITDRARFVGATKVLVFLSQKGGSGKTTLAVHTAVAASEAGMKTVLIDTDPQHSATVWGDARTSDEPQVATVAGSEIDRVLIAARAEGIGLAVVDTAPHTAPEAARIARNADLVLIPCRPTAFDLAAAGSAAMIVKAAGVSGAFVLSACPVRAPEIAETRKALAGYGLPVAPVEITERRAFSRAIATGRAVTEFESDGRAADEIRALWEWIWKWIRTQP